MHGPTLPFALTKTYDPISVNLKEKQRKKKKIFLSSHLLLFYFIFFFFSFFILIIIIWIYGSYWLIQVHFFPKKNYLFSLHFILNELNLSHFLTSKIFVKISSLKSLTAYHPKNRKNIPLVLKFNETFLRH